MLFIVVAFFACPWYGKVKPLYPEICNLLLIMEQEHYCLFLSLGIVSGGIGWALPSPDRANKMKVCFSY